MCVLPDGKKMGLTMRRRVWVPMLSGLEEWDPSTWAAGVGFFGWGLMGTDGDSMFLWYSGYPLVIELIDDLPHLRHQRSSATRNSSIKNSKNDKA
jgi:hypothetical protein